MTETETLVLENLLNGVEPAQAGAAFGLSEVEVTTLFAEVMRRVSEYTLVHCVPLFECTIIANARRNRQAVLEILDSIRRWDSVERDMALAMLKGRNVMREDGVPRETAEAVLNRTLAAVPHYLTEARIREFADDKPKFVREHRFEVIAAVEKFVSFREPFLYTRITHSAVSAKDLT